MVEIKALERANPQDVTTSKKYYAQAITYGLVDLERLAYLLSNQCTLRESDCDAVLIALQHNISDELNQSKIVKLDKLGRSQIGVCSIGMNQLNKVSGDAVKNFALQNACGNVKEC